MYDNFPVVKIVSFIAVSSFEILFSIFVLVAIIVVAVAMYRVRVLHNRQTSCYFMGLLGSNVMI